MELSPFTAEPGVSWMLAEAERRHRKSSGKQTAPAASTGPGSWGAEQGGPPGPSSGSEVSLHKFSSFETFLVVGSLNLGS